jgi:hypothetical protein
LGYIVKPWLFKKIKREKKDKDSFH